MRILLVEDEAKVSRAVALGLKAEHYAVDTAKDGREGLELAVVNPYDLLIVDLTTVEQMCLLAAEKHIEAACETHEPVEVEGDHSRLKQVIVNLLDNAIKYTPEGGKISLSVHAENGSALLEIADTGPGVAESALPHLFKRFCRVDEAHSREVEGAGLGLFIVHSICTAHGGSVSIRNFIPTGCQATVQLPRAK